MSKPNKKDNKKDSASSGIQQAYQNQKRQLLDCQFSIRKFQQRLNDITAQNLSLKSKMQQSSQLFNESIQQLTLKNMANQKRLLALSNQKTKLQIENQQKDNKIKMLEKCLFDQQQNRLKDFEQMRKNYNFDLAKYQSQLSQYKLYMNQRDQLEQQRQQLRQKIQIQKANKLRDIADKQRQKVQATDKLKDQMLYKINQMRKNLFSLKKQQLSTTTRLTMLQNHQLTSQLEYQSKQTQKIIFKNQDLQQKNNSLRQQLDIHKQVQEQLAKRSHFSKGVIRKLNLRINQLQGQVEDYKNQLCLPQKKDMCNSKSSQKIKISNNFTIKQQNNNQSQLQQRRTEQRNSYNSNNNKSLNQSNKKHILNLQQSLQKAQKMYAELLLRYQNVFKEKQLTINKLKIFQLRSNQLFKILYRFYNQSLLKEKNTEQLEVDKMQEDVQNSANQQSQLTYDFLNQKVPFDFDLKKMRQTPVDKWTQQDLTLTVQILMNVIQPYLIKSNLLVPAIRKNIILNDNSNLKRQAPKMDSNRSLPKLLTQRKQMIQSKMQQIPANIASKIVGSNLREWGQTLKLNKTGLSRKYKVTQSYRG